MPINITMPALSPTMEEGNLAKWLVKEGDKVSSGDVIAEIETDKATMEVEAVDEGMIAKIVVPGGTEGVKVNAVIAILAEEGEDVAEAAKGGGSCAGARSRFNDAEAKAEDAAGSASYLHQTPVATPTAPVRITGICRRSARILLRRSPAVLPKRRGRRCRPRFRAQVRRVA